MPWLFGRRSGKAAKLKEGRPAPVTDRVDQTYTTQPADGLRRGPSQRNRRRRGSARSAASMRHVDQTLPPDALRKDAALLDTADDTTALPPRRQHSPHLAYNLTTHSHASLPQSAKLRGKLQRPQSLRRDPPADSSLVRRMSSRRRKEHDHAREEEIRAMAFPMPQKRPAAASGGMLRRDSKKVKAGLNHRFEQATSNVSLPHEDSAHSSMSSNSDLRAFRVSALDMFSPRPTIRFSLGSQYHGGERASPNGYHEKTERGRERRPLSSRDDKQSKRSSRIADLADTLDAGALREIMERDKRRREKKAQMDDDRLRRRLERRAEKQNAVEAGRASLAPNREAVGTVGLGIEKNVSSPMDDIRPSTPQQPLWVETLPVTPRACENNQLPTPLDSPMEEPVVSDARAVRYSRGSVSAQVHTRGPSNVSDLPDLISEKLAQDNPFESVEQAHDPTRSGSLHPVETADTTAESKRGSTRRRSSDGRRMGVFASLFRRGKRNSQDQGHITPSEISFSNTSRESMSRQPIPAHLIGPVSSTQPIQIRRPSSLPRRTMSKFREDLPEFPLSPPDSRVQSPEVPSTSAIAARRRTQVPSDLRVQSVSSQAGTRSDSPVSPGLPVGNIMSQSLASVDSEGSWLSGRPPKRASNRSQMQPSITSSGPHRNDDFNASYEELGMADDEYFKRLTPQPDEHFRSAYAHDNLGRKASSTLMALDPAAESEEEGEATPARKTSGENQVVKSIVGRQPTIIHRRPRVKSTEGLLSMFVDDKSARDDPFVDVGSETADSPTSDNEPMMVQRAKSVDLGKQHVRHLSAGSARLLDIHKRSSTTSHSKTLEQE